MSDIQSLMEKHAEKTSRLSYLHQERLEQTLRMFRRVQSGGASDTETWTASGQFARYRAEKEKRQLLALLREANANIEKNKSEIESTQSNLSTARGVIDQTVQEVEKQTELRKGLVEYVNSVTASLGKAKSLLAETAATVETHTDNIVQAQAKSVQLTEALDALKRMFEAWSTQGSPSSPPNPELTSQVEQVNKAIADFQKFQTETLDKLANLDKKVDDTKAASHQEVEAARNEIKLVQGWSDDLLRKYLGLRREILDTNLLYLNDYIDTTPDAYEVGWMPLKNDLVDIGLTAVEHPNLIEFRGKLQGLEDTWKEAKSLQGTAESHDQLVKAAAKYAEVQSLIKTSGLEQFLQCMTEYEEFIRLIIQKGYLSSKSGSRIVSGPGLPPEGMSIFDLFEAVLAGPSGPTKFNRAEYERLLGLIR